MNMLLVYILTSYRLMFAILIILFQTDAHGTKMLFALQSKPRKEENESTRVHIS